MTTSKAPAFTTYSYLPKQKRQRLYRHSYHRVKPDAVDRHIRDYLSRYPTTTAVSAEMFARELNIPKHQVDQSLQRLTTRGLFAGKENRRPSGGRVEWRATYWLVRHKEQP
jgi:predicted ArsR family transcriptional regulator